MHWIVRPSRAFVAAALFVLASTGPLAAQGVTTRIAAVPRAGGPVRLGVDLVGAAGAPVVARDGRIAWVESQPTAPSEVWAAERAGLAGRPVSSVNAEVSKLRLGSTRAVRWTSTDGTAVEGLLACTWLVTGGLAALDGLHGISRQEDLQRRRAREARPR